MKKTISILFFFCSFFLVPKIIFAASFSITSSTKQVSPNSTFTVSVGGDAIGRVNLSVKNGTLSTSSVWVEQNRQTVTVTAFSSGSVVITATPQKGFSDADANEYNPGAKSVQVNIVAPNNKPSGSNKPSTNPKPSQPSSGTQKPVVDTKSSENSLSSLKISVGTLVSEFSSDVKNYTVNLPKDSTSLKIEGTSKHEKARIEGLGEKKLKELENVFDIVVTAENGEKKTYQIKAIVEETPSIYFTYDDTSVGVLSYVNSEIVPKEFEKKEVSVGEKNISVFSNEQISLIYGVSGEEKSFYLFDETKQECISKFVPMKLFNRDYYLIDSEEFKGMKPSSLTIEEQEVMGYVFEDEGMDQYFLLSAVNNQGEKVKYLYEKSEGTLQLYLNQAPITYQEYEKLVNKVHFQTIFLVILSVLLLGIVVFLVYLFVLRKGKSHEKNA